MRHSLRCGSIDGFLATRSSFVHGSARRDGTVASRAPPSPTLVPSAVGVREGASVPVGTGTRGLSQLLRGGMSLVSSGQPSTALPPQAHEAPTMAPQAHEAPLATVPMIDVLYWLRTAFGVADHVVRGMGAPNAPRSETRSEGPACNPRRLEQSRLGSPL